MKRRSFRVYAVKEDLQDIFREFQSELELFYVPSYSDTGESVIHHISGMENLGVNFYVSHIGNMQMLVFQQCIMTMKRLKIV